MAVAVKIEGLSFSPMPGLTPDVLHEISFELPVGARCVVVGQNGAGKSTLLELVGGLKMAAANCISVFGSDPFRAPARDRVTALVQGGWRGDGGEIPVFTRVAEYLGFGDSPSTLVADTTGEADAGKDASPTSDSPPCRRQERLCEALGLRPLLSRFIGMLSDGERRRVELGRKLKERSDLVLLDEATTDLDLLVRQTLLTFLQQEGSTVVNVTHVFDGLEPWATHLVHMHEGKLIRCEAIPETGAKPWASMGGLFDLSVAWLKEGTDSDIPTAPVFAANAGSITSQNLTDAIEVSDLRFSYAPGSPVVVRVDALKLPRGCRCVLVGPNGAGKSTLLSILAGRRLVEVGQVQVLERRAFHDHTLLDPLVALLSSEWKKHVAELSVGKSLSFRELADVAMKEAASAGTDVSILAGRMVRLIQMLRIDPTKPMGTLSDGMMRRAQIALKLLKPTELLLIDEVTADLDVLSRQALLSFLKEESQAGCTIIYCTHILDGMDGWSSHLLRIRKGDSPSVLYQIEDVLSHSTELLHAVRQMLQEDTSASASKDPIQPSHEEAVRHADLAGGEAELPSGWESRTATKPGAFGNYAWRSETGPEDSWSFASVAPAPPSMPTAAGAAPGQMSASPLGAPGSFLAAGQVAASFPSSGYAGNADPCPAGFGQRNNAVPLAELIAKGVVQRERPY